MAVNKNVVILKTIHSIVIVFGIIFGFFSFFSSFGIWFVSSGNEDKWVGWYTIISGCLTFPTIFIGLFLPRLSGALLLGEAIITSLLILINGHKSLSVVLNDDIYWSAFSWWHISVTLTVLGLVLLFVGWRAKKNKFNITFE